MKIIYLIRHSKPIEKNKISFIDCPNTQLQNQLIPLSLDGENIAKTLANKMINLNIKSIWSSTYIRAISTAKYISDKKKLTIKISSNFDERKLGDSEGFDETFWLTQLYDENAKAPNGESRKEVTERMITGLYSVLDEMNEKESSIIVTHATAITFLLMKWCKLEKAELKGKKRWLKFNEKDVINDSFNTPEIFKLVFDERNLISINRVEKGGIFDGF